MAEAQCNLFAVHEAHMLARGVRRQPVPVVLVAGALGSGKTTLLQLLATMRVTRPTLTSENVFSLSQSTRTFPLRVKHFVTVPT